MNLFLFYSALLYGLLLWFLLYTYRGKKEVGILEVVIVVGILTSLWNHGTTNSVALISDRAMMAVSFLLVIGLCVRNRCTSLLLLLLLSVGLYLAAKTMGQDVWHFTGLTVAAGLLAFLVVRLT